MELNKKVGIASFTLFVFAIGMFAGSNIVNKDSPSPTDAEKKSLTKSNVNRRLLGNDTDLDDGDVNQSASFSRTASHSIRDPEHTKGNSHSNSKPASVVFEPLVRPDLLGVEKVRSIHRRYRLPTFESKILNKLTVDQFREYKMAKYKHHFISALKEEDLVRLAAEISVDKKLREKFNYYFQKVKANQMDGARDIGKASGQRSTNISEAKIENRLLADLRILLSNEMANKLSKTSF